jgi:hypothetical protein
MNQQGADCVFDVLLATKSGSSGGQGISKVAVQKQLRD